MESHSNDIDAIARFPEAATNNVFLIDNGADCAELELWYKKQSESILALKKINDAYSQRILDTSIALADAREIVKKLKERIERIETQISGIIALDHRREKITEDINQTQLTITDTVREIKENIKSIANLKQNLAYINSPGYERRGPIPYHHRKIFELQHIQNTITDKTNKKNKKVIVLQNMAKNRDEKIKILRKIEEDILKLKKGVEYNSATFIKTDKEIKTLITTMRSLDNLQGNTKDFVNILDTSCDFSS